MPLYSKRRSVPLYLERPRWIVSDGMSNKEERARQAKVFDMLCFPTICNWNSSHRVPDFTKVKRPQPSLSKEMSAAEKSADASSVENVMMRQGRPSVISS